MSGTRMTVMMVIFLAGSLTFLAGTYQGVAAAERTVELRILGCNCGGTYQIVRIVIWGIPGVKEINASHIAQSVKITFDDTKTGPAQFKKAIEDEHIQVIGEPKWIGNVKTPNSSPTSAGMPVQ